MALSHSTSAVGRITTIDPATRRVEIGLRDGSTVQIAVIESGPFFRWPVEGEIWRICRRGYTWYLDSQVEQTHTDDMHLEDLEAGETKVYSEVIKTPSGKQLATLDDLPGPALTVTGSRDGNEALASLLTALDSLGLIVDETTA